jgi:hypothetical protein
MMAYLEDLQTEIQTDSLARGYSGMTNAEVADSLNNTIDRNVNKTNVTGSEVWALVDYTEYSALTVDERNEVRTLCGIDNHDPFGPSADLVQDIFGGGAGPNTVAALSAYRVDTVSRATELGFGFVTEGDVEKALVWPVA